jgi:hypothetical protein
VSAAALAWNLWLEQWVWDSNPRINWAKDQDPTNRFISGYQ